MKRKGIYQMSYILNPKLNNLDPYTVNIEDYKIKLDANESFLSPGEKLGKKISEELTRLPLNRYPDDCYQELRNAFGKHYRVDPDLVVAGNGSDEFLSIIIGSFMKSDDSILLSEPDFSMYNIFAQTYERESYSIERTLSGEPDIYLILEKVEKENIKVILFSNPSASFSVVTQKEKILHLVDNTNALVIVDEAYMDFSDQSVLGEVAQRNNLIVLRTCSKAAGLAGIRLGFAVASKELTEVLNCLRPPYNLNILTETVGRLVLSDEGYIDNAIKDIKANRDELYKEIESMNADHIFKRIYPTATNYICIDSDYSNYIFEELKKRSILIRNFGDRLRITAGTQEENRTLIKEINQILTSIDGEENNETSDNRADY